MKIQPPLFLLLTLLGVSSFLWIIVPWGIFAFAAFGLLFLAAIMLNIPEATSLSVASRRTSFFFKGMGLQILRGFAWGLGLGVGGIRQVAYG
jgi:hypothetical protein